MLFFNTIVTLIKLKLQIFCEMSCLKKMHLFFLEIMQGLILFHLEIHSLILFYSILFYSFYSLRFYSMRFYEIRLNTTKVIEFDNLYKILLDL